MKEVLNKLANSLFQKDSLYNCSKEELTILADQYPYFSSLQLLLAKKLKDQGDDNYKEQLQKTSLYFNNTLWLEEILNERKHIELSQIAEEKKTSPVQLEDIHNDELVVENPRYEIPVPVIASIQQEPIIEKKGEETIIDNKSKVEPAFEFEPYHTVDYFASQGIKPVLEEKPTDHFGQQLKSFTEWLKAIRKMPPQEISTLIDSRSEEKVVNLAVHSIEDREVVTEAMAEVWIKQGYPEKAIDIYNKLSLLNTSKSGYFAGLIENLKKY